MTKQDYIDGIKEFFHTDEYLVNWSGFDSKNAAQKNGIEQPNCKVFFLKGGEIVRSAECSTEIAALREIYKEIYEIEYQESLIKSQKEAAILKEKQELEEKNRWKSQLESDILQAISDRNYVMIQVGDGEMRQCFIGGTGLLHEDVNGIVVYQYHGKTESNNNKWYIFREDEIKSFHIMTEWHKVIDIPDGYDSDKIWRRFKTIYLKLNTPEKKPKGFFSKLFRK